MAKKAGGGICVCKGVGLVLICTSCVLLGVSFKWRYQREVVLIGLFRTILLELQEEIIYGKYPLAECFYRIAQRKSGGTKALLLGMYEECMDEAAHPMEVFTQHACRYLEKEGVPKKVALQVVSGIAIGNMEQDMQYRLLQQSAGHLERLYEAKEKERGDKEKLAVTLGVMGGCFFFLFLI